MSPNPDFIGDSASSPPEKPGRKLRKRNPRFEPTPVKDVPLNDSHLTMLSTVQGFYTPSIYQLTKVLNLDSYITLTTNPIDPRKYQQQWENLLYNTAERARTLWRLDYLQKVPVPSRHEDVYGLGQRSIYPLTRYQGVKRRDIRVFTMAKGYSLGHEMMAGDFRTAAMMAMTAMNHPIGAWRRKPRLQTGSWRKEADYEWIVPRPDSPSTFYVEIDRGTESVIGNGHDIAEKFEFYIQLYRQEWEGVQFNPNGRQKSFRVLVTTTSPRRVKTMIEAVKSQDPKRWGMFWIAVQSAYALHERRVLDPIWSTARHEKPQSLF